MRIRKRVDRPVKPNTLSHPRAKPPFRRPFHEIPEQPSEQDIIVAAREDHVGEEVQLRLLSGSMRPQAAEIRYFNPRSRAVNLGIEFRRIRSYDPIVLV
jgi:hypothetical protein